MTHKLNGFEEFRAAPNKARLASFRTRSTFVGKGADQGAVESAADAKKRRAHEIATKITAVSQQALQGIAMLRAFEQDCMPLIDKAVSDGIFSSRQEVLKYEEVQTAIRALYEIAAGRIKSEQDQFKRDFFR